MNILLESKTRELHWSEVSNVPYVEECLTIRDKMEPIEKKQITKKINERLYDQQVFLKKNVK